MTDSVTGIVLCGGSGRRFGGLDKPLEPLSGRPLIEHVLERVVPQVEHLIISANRHHRDYQRYGFPVVADAAADSGPLAGIQAAARFNESELLFVCPGDSPLLPRSLVTQLRSRLADGDGVEVVIPHDGERAQHLFLLMPRAVALTIDPYLDAGRRSVAGWLAERSVVEHRLADLRAFTNVNTISELATLSEDWDQTSQ